LVLGDGLGNGNLFSQINELGFGGDGNVEIVPAKDVVHVEALRLMQSDGEILEADFRRVAGWYWHLAAQYHTKHHCEAQQ
jgi:hypothetical protein